jgi:hypothetical protein
MEEIQKPELGEKKAKKAQKKGEYRLHRLRIGLTTTQLQAYWEMAQKAGYCNLAQKLFTENKRTGQKTVHVKAIQKFIREIVVPYYQAGEEERIRRAADAMRRKLEAEADLAKQGVKV